MEMEAIESLEILRYETMADDTRQSQQQEDLSREALNVNPENKAFTGTQWQDGQAQTYHPPQNANMLAGGTENTAGGKIPEATIANAFQTIKLEEFPQFYKKPCVRDAWMTGMGAGFGLGGLRLILRKPVWNACNWAVGTFTVSSFGMYQYCLNRRKAEKEGMMRAVEILNRKDVEKRAREARKEKAREDRRKAKEEEQDAQLATLKEAHESKMDNGDKKSWWKVW